MDHNKDIATSSTAMPSTNHKKGNEHVQHSEVPPEIDTRIETPSHRSFTTKLGQWNITVLLAGAVATCLAMAFLALLWAGSESAKRGERTPPLWFNIVEVGWATRVVTVASVLIRVAAAAQMGVFAALMAAWILETTGASAEHLPLLSIIRTVNNGPQSHVWNVLHSLHTGSRYFYSAVIILAILDGLALQFTSTLLITDFGKTTILPPSIRRTFPYGSSTFYGSNVRNIQAGTGVSFYQNAPSAYTRFAEYATPAHLDTEYADTGESLRAYLPFGLSEARSALHEYKGPATVVDNRVRCARPSMSIHNVTFLYENLATNVPYEIAIAGNLTLEGTIPGATTTPVNEEHHIEGAFLTSAMARIHSTQYTNKDWRLAYSIPSVIGVDFPGGLSSASSYSRYPLLLVNITGDGWADVLESVVESGSDNLVVGPYEWSQSPAGIWSTLKTNDSSLDIGFSATLCFADSSAINYNIHARREQEFTSAEPRNLSWDAVTEKYDTYEVRHMLGATNERSSPTKRGIFDLRPPANWTLNEIADGGSDWLTEGINSGLMRLFNPQMSINYPFASAYRLFWGTSADLTPFSLYSSIHRTHSAIFQDIIQTTGNPALAFQALFAILTQMAYYDLLPQYDLTGNATYTLTKQVEVPVQWKGFIVVTTLLVFHVGLIITAVVLFLSKTGHSLLGNAWQAVAQVSSSDTMDTMHHASNMTDLEVKRLLKLNSYEDCEVVLRTGADDGRSQALYKKGVAESC